MTKAPRITKHSNFFALNQQTIDTLNCIAQKRITLQRHASRERRRKKRPLNPSLLKIAIEPSGYLLQEHADIKFFWHAELQTGAQWPGFMLANGHAATKSDAMKQARAAARKFAIELQESLQ